MKHCSQCGARVERRPVEGDHLERWVCVSCEEIHYQNPKMIVGTLPLYEEKILLCQRAIDPCRGKWTLPAGFMEEGETVEEAARRETLEETRAEVELIRLHSVYSIPHISHVYVIFLAKLKDRNFGPTSESLKVELFDQSELPWSEVAFSSIQFALREYVERPQEEYTRLGTYDPSVKGLNFKD